MQQAAWMQCNLQLRVDDDIEKNSFWLLTVAFGRVLTVTLHHPCVTPPAQAANYTYFKVHPVFELGKERDGFLLWRYASIPSPDQKAWHN